MYTAKDFSHLLGSQGLSDTMLTNHFTLYQGYVTNANKLIEKLDTVERGGYEYGELKRRLGWEVNGIKLHELYFENLTRDTTEVGEDTATLLAEAYGSQDEWQASLKRNCLTRGIGWVVLVYEESTKKVFHTWVGEHNVGNLLGAKILLVIDCWEHAYMTDYGIKRGDYVDAVIKRIDWRVVEERVDAVRG